jgi:predicted ATP-grasp superfamily ATP-dependent carboligase
MVEMTGFDHRRVPAIVVGRGATALGILRCLHLAGILAFVACPVDDEVTRSRWFRPTPGVTAWDGTIDANAIHALREMPLDEAVLIPGADDAALWLANSLQGDLRQRFHISSSSRATLEILQDKVKFAECLRNTSMPHPRTFHIASAEDIEAIPFDKLDRVFIKPANSQRFSDVTGTKGFWVESRDALLRKWRPLHEQGFKLMAQEYVPGTAADHYFIDGFRDRKGDLTGLFARRRIRIYPPGFGNSSYCRSIPLSEIPAPVDNLADLLAKLDYRGIFSAEFKRDARDGAFRILEINTRAWTYVEFAARCRVNVCEMAYRDALDQPVETASRDYRMGAGCVDFHRDFWSVRGLPAAQRDPLPKVLLQWADAHFHSFRLDDPGPGLFYARRVMAEHFQRKFGRSRT